MTPAAFREADTEGLGSAAIAQVLDLCRVCWPEGGFTQDDLDHALGGRHFLAEVDGRVVGHASVVPRVIEVGGRPLATGYVEAVATLPRLRRQGIATRLMQAANRRIGEAFELGALSTGEPAFYERLGWRRWRGETWVRLPDGQLARTPDDDAGVLVLMTPATPPLTLREPLCCAWRPGDVW